MTKLVHTGHMVAHLWANQSQEEARSHNGNLWFEGRLAGYYRTPLAQLVPGIGGALIPLISSESYGKPRTSGVLSHLYRAVGYRGHIVPHIDTRSRGWYDAPAATWPEVHKANLEYLMGQYASTAARLKRMRQDPYDTQGSLDHAARKVLAYARDFGLEVPAAIDTEADAKAIAEARAARDTPEARAKREKAKARREAREAEIARLEALQDEEREAAWLGGAPVSIRHTRTPLLRLKPGRAGTVQTSWGAEVPLEAAKLAFRMAKLCRAKGQPWERNGHVLPVGSFEVDRIDPEGNMRAGCHLLLWDEMARFAAAIGLGDLEAADTSQARA